MHWIIATILTMTALGSVTAHAMTGGSVDAKFRGTWVPASAACTSPLQLVIEANKVTFVHGAQRAEYRQLEQCFTCMGRDVDQRDHALHRCQGRLSVYALSRRLEKEAERADRLQQRHEARRALSVRHSRPEALPMIRVVIAFARGCLGMPQ